MVLRLRAVRLAILAAGVLPSCVRHVAPHPDPAAALSLRALVVTLPLADSADAWARAGRAFHWRVSAGATILSLDVPASTPGRPLVDALAAAVPARCEAGHVLVCAQPIAAEARDVGGRVAFTVHDSAVVRRVQHEAPAAVRRGLWQYARLVAVDSIPLTRLP